MYWLVIYLDFCNNPSAFVSDNKHKNALMRLQEVIEAGRLEEYSPEEINDIRLVVETLKDLPQTAWTDEEYAYVQKMHILIA